MPRTTRVAGDGKRYPLNMRTTKEVRDRLEWSARENGRSMSQEVEFRLEQSFAREGLLAEVLALAYGSHLAGLMMLAGEAMWRAGISAALQKALSQGEKDGLRDRMRDWASDPEAFNQAVHAAVSALDWARPVDAEGPASVPSEKTSGVVENLIHDVKHAPKILGPDDRVQHIHRLLGAAALRETPSVKRRATRLAAAGRRKGTAENAEDAS